MSIRLTKSITLLIILLFFFGVSMCMSLRFFTHFSFHKIDWKIHIGFTPWIFLFYLFHFDIGPFSCISLLLLLLLFSGMGLRSFWCSCVLHFFFFSYSSSIRKNSERWSEPLFFHLVLPFIPRKSFVYEYIVIVIQ